MKNLYLIAAILCSFYTTAQVTVTVDPTLSLKTLNGFENGINLNYLTDGTYIDSISNTTSALKRMGIKMLRYPGGEKSDNYLFSGYPWKESSPRMASKDNRGWPTSDARFVDTSSAEKLCLSNVLDFDEMVAMAKEIEAEPLIVVAYDVMYLDYKDEQPALRPTKEEIIEHAVEWVRYANIKKKYGIKYWMIGNESWNNPDYNGQTTATQYAKDVYEFAVAMKAADPTIKIIANGQRSWWPALLQSPAVTVLDILSFSNYPVWNYGGGYRHFKNNKVNLTGEVDAAIKAIEDYAPAEHKSRLKVLPSEYNSIDWSGSWKNDNNLGHAICNFQMFGDMIVKPKVESMCLWNTRWTDVIENEQQIYDALDIKGNLNATGLVQEVWGKNLLHKMVSSTSTYSMIKTYASYDTSFGALNVLILNKDSVSKKINLRLQNYVSDFGGALWVFSGDSVGDKFPNYKWVEGISGPGDLTYLEVPPTAITVVKLFAPFIFLPVKIKEFKGSTDGSKVLLSWKAEEKEDLAKYIIEKAIGNSDFLPIGEVNRKGINTIYSFSDMLQVSSVNVFYRLKLVYANAAVSFSNVVQIKQKIHHEEIIKLIPNPVIDVIKLQIQTSVTATYKLEIYNQQGRKVLLKNKLAKQGVSIISVDEANSLKSGIYYLKIFGGMKLHALTFIKN